ncbi:MAG: N-acetylglucosamine-6-phosphate deacetylase [Firmicutes bacterium ADurb.Bin356]|nr:MAG: N-acetylglucosamine-6-phosphate deacetylase [Firmicutes bacterium ADurb.Bin356]
MLIKNANVFCEDSCFRKMDVRFEENIVESGTLKGKGFDASGYMLIPGLVDIHTHGAMNADTSDGIEQALKTMSRFYAMNGITSFLATTMTYDEIRLEQAMRVAGSFTTETGATCIGINMEGPFINPLKKGAQASKNIIPPDFAMLKRLNKAANNRIKLIDLAPELPNALDFIERAAKLATVSLAHTAADYDTAMQAFENGATHVTHLFNAMEPFLHRSPGIIGAAADAGASVEVICDGIHLHPAVIRAVFKLFDKSKICFISDSMRSAGLADGEYELGGQPVTVQGGKAMLHDGTIAGSSINLMQAVKNAIKFGIKQEAALSAATMNPARAIKMDKYIGSIISGKQADMVLIDKQWNIKKVFVKGKEFA